MVAVGTAAHLRLQQPTEHTCGRFGKLCGASTGLHSTWEPLARRGLAALRARRALIEKLN